VGLSPSTPIIRRLLGLHRIILGSLEQRCGGHAQSAGVFSGLRPFSHFCRENVREIATWQMREWALGRCAPRAAGLSVAEYLTRSDVRREAVKAGG
jgi:hypothetical protein